MHYIEYSDHCSPNEMHDFLSQLSFSRIIGLSVQMTPRQVDSFERLSLTQTVDMPAPGEAEAVEVNDNSEDTVPRSILRRFFFFRYYRTGAVGLLTVI